MAEGHAMSHLLDRLLQTQDMLLMKLLRNLAMHAGPASQLLPYAADLIKLCQQVDVPELLVELLGTLGSLPLHTLPDLPRLVQKCASTVSSSHVTASYSFCTAMN